MRNCVGYSTSCEFPFTRFDIRGRLSVHNDFISTLLPNFTITSTCAMRSHQRLALNISAINNNAFLPVVAHDGCDFVSSIVRYQGTDQVQSAVNTGSDTASSQDA